MKLDQVLDAAAVIEHRAIANMIAVVIRDYADEKGLGSGTADAASEVTAPPPRAHRRRVIR